MFDNAGHRGPEFSAGVILALVASGRVKSRSDIANVLGWSRATIMQRLGFLLAAGLVDEAAETLPSGGRPARVLRLNTHFGIVLAADIGEKKIRLAITDLTPSIIVETFVDQEVGAGPVPILTSVAKGFEELLARVGRTAEEAIGIGLGLPAPVDFGAGRVVGPSVMRGWDDFDIPNWLRSRFDVPVCVENDVNLLALCESRRFWPNVDQFFYVKAGTGIGSGILSDRRLQRGAQGAAGDIGHIQIAGPNGPLCRCGKLGCVEAYASGWAISRDLRALGFEAEESRDVLKFVRANEPKALQLVRAAGRVLGEVVACAVSMFNPSVIVIGGTLSGAEEHLLAGVREIVYQRSLPLATRDLKIALGQSGGEAGILGAALLVMETEMQVGAVERVVARHSRRVFGK
jgi:predicted NBD/HSP70 family sugar kinase